MRNVGGKSIHWLNFLFIFSNFQYFELFFDGERVFSQSEMYNLTARTKQGASTIHYGENENNLEIPQLNVFFTSNFISRRIFLFTCDFLRFFLFPQELNHFSFLFIFNVIFLGLFFLHFQCFLSLFFLTKSFLYSVSSVTFIFIEFLLVSLPTSTPLAFCL